MDQKLPMKTVSQGTARMMADRGHHAVSSQVALYPLKVQDLGPALEAALAG